VHRIPLPVGDPEHVPEILAIRTIEVLRASALKQLVESSRAAVAARAPRAPALPASEPDRPTVRASNTFGIETGIAVVESVGGIGAAAIPMLRFRAELTRTIFLRLGVAALGSRPTVMTSIGSATVSQAFGLLEAGLAFRPDRRLQPLITVGAGALRVTFTPYYLPVRRGILATVYGRLLPGKTGADAAAAVKAFVADRPFLRATKPEGVRLQAVVGTNRVLMAADADPERGVAIAFAAIDNLVKGAAGQAVQNANLMFGLAETAGLDLLGGSAP